jgi:hypothetical protein
MEHGLKLTWAQADDLGDETIDWMRSRLGLKGTTSDRGITFNPDPSSTRAHATVRHSAARKSPRPPPRRADINVVASLAEQDTSGEVVDSYARTGDAADTILRWYASARSAGDTDLVETIDRMGVAAAAKAYEAARPGALQSKSSETNDSRVVIFGKPGSQPLYVSPWMTKAKADREVRQHRAMNTKRGHDDYEVVLEPRWMVEDREEYARRHRAKS